MRKTEHHTIEGNRKTKKQYQTTFLLSAGNFSSDCFFSFYYESSEYTDALDQCTDQNSCFNSCFIHLQQNKHHP